MKANHLKRCILEKGPKGQQSTAYDHITPKGENYKLMRERLDKRFFSTRLDFIQLLPS